MVYFRCNTVNTTVNKYTFNTILSASVVGNDDDGVLPITRNAMDNEYFEFNSTTNKWTCKKAIPNAICFLFVRCWQSGAGEPTSMLSVNDTGVLEVSTPSGTLNSHNGKVVSYNFQQGDTFCIYRPSSRGWNEPHLLIYFIENSPFINTNIDWDTGYNSEILSDMGLAGFTYDYE